MTIVERTIASPLGPLRLLANSGALVGLYFSDHRVRTAAPVPERRSHPILNRAAIELDEYFAGQRRQFTVAVAAAGTEFQRAVWAALGSIDYGLTRSYGELARALGRPKSARAVGSANGRNPISIIVPCHRVIGGGGALTGYAGGLERKRWLLEHEDTRARAKLLG